MDLFKVNFSSDRDEIYKRVGIQLGFIATRSGLLRYSDHSHLFKPPKEEGENDGDQKEGGAADDHVLLDDDEPVIEP